jgi:hypothetical protein
MLLPRTRTCKSNACGEALVVEISPTQQHAGFVNSPAVPVPPYTRVI